MLRPQLPQVRFQRQLDLLPRFLMLPQISQDVGQVRTLSRHLGMLRPQLPPVLLQRQLQLAPPPLSPRGPCPPPAPPMPGSPRSPHPWEAPSPPASPGAARRPAHSTRRDPPTPCPALRAPPPRPPPADPSSECDPARATRTG